MRTLVIDHPLVAHKMSRLRREETSSASFRLLAEELVTLLAYEATRSLTVHAEEITTPVATTTGHELGEPKPLVVPILRAGLGMLNGMVKLMPTSEVGFLGLVRDENTLTASIYADRLPHDMHDRQVFVLDPMLATGGTLERVDREIEQLHQRPRSRRSTTERLQASASRPHLIHVPRRDTTVVQARDQLPVRVGPAFARILHHDGLIRGGKSLRNPR